MQYNLQQATHILQRTPLLLEVLLKDIPEEWSHQHEGENTWSPFDVVGHLLHGERTDWMTRTNLILAQGENRTFTPFDRFAQFEESKGKSMNQLLEEFKAARAKNLEELQHKDLGAAHYALKGIHPVFGEVTLSNLLSTWVAHDLNHIGQIVRVMAKQYKEEVGPWIEYLRILKS